MTTAVIPPEALGTKECERCGKAFQLTRKHRAKRFCSISCARSTLPVPDPKSCVQCGKEFQPTTKYPQQRFCGHKCQWASRGGAAFSARVARESAKKRGDKQRGRGTGKSYPKLNGRHAHRVVAEEKLGRPLNVGEVVHHGDENKQNYQPDNLAVLPSQADHARLHFKGKKHSAEHVAKCVSSRKRTMAARKAGQQ